MIISSLNGSRKPNYSDSYIRETFGPMRLCFLSIEIGENGSYVNWYVRRNTEVYTNLFALVRRVRFRKFHHRFKLVLRENDRRTQKTAKDTGIFTRFDDCHAECLPCGMYGNFLDTTRSIPGSWDSCEILEDTPRNTISRRINGRSSSIPYI